MKQSGHDRVKSVEGDFVTVQSGWGFWVGEGYGPRIEPRDYIERLEHRGMVRGILVNGVTLWERSVEEMEAERQSRIADAEEKDRLEQAESREAYAARLSADPLAFDWDREGPSEQAATALSRVRDESEFPVTYSGQAWRRAFRLWRLTETDPEALDGVGPYDRIPGDEGDGYDLELSGFMEGWARNCVRQMRGKRPRPNGALVAIGEPFEQDALPSRRSAAADLKEILG